MSKARTQAPRRAAAALAANPTHGYDVFRPWSLQPAPCPGTCSTPNMPLKDWYHDLAAQYPRLVKETVIGHSRQGQSIMAYKVTADARNARDGRRPAVLYDSTQHAREWIATEVERRLFAYVRRATAATASIKRLLGTRELWFVPVVNPDGYDYTFTSPATRLWRKNLRDNDGDGADRRRRRRRHQPQLPVQVELGPRGRVRRPRRRDLPRRRPPASEPEVKAMRGLESAHPAERSRSTTTRSPS